MSKNTAKAALLVCMCAILCACSAPEGYYDDNDTEAHCYIIYCKDVGYHYNYGAVESETFMRWVELKKINGYWKIGMLRSSSPPSDFFTES